MNKETMTIHQALCELKILDARIKKAIDNCQFVGMTKHIAQKVGNISVADFVNNEKEAYQSATDLIKRRAAIKRAVVLSNAVTKVVIGGVEYSVAEAIEFKNHGLDGKKALRDRMDIAYRYINDKINKLNNELDVRAESYVTSMCGSKDSKTSSDEVKKLREDFVQAQTVELVDPIDVVAKMKVLDDEIAVFTTQVDSALSVSNALTTIEIEY